MARLQTGPLITPVPLHRCYMPRNSNVCKFIDLLRKNPGGLHKSILMRRLDISSESTFFRTLRGARILSEGGINCKDNTYLFANFSAETETNPFIPTDDDLLSLVTLQKILSGMTSDILREAFEPLRQRLTEYLQNADPKAGTWPSKVKILDIHHRHIDGTVFRIALKASAHKHVIRFTYTDAYGKKSERIVSPQQLVRYKDNWYLDGWCHESNGLRIFSLDNITDIRKANRKCKSVGPEVLQRIYATSYGIFSGAPAGTAVIRFTGLAARYVLRESWHPAQKLTRFDDGTIELAIPYNKPQELLREILARGNEAEIVSPQCLRDEIAGILEKTAGKYRKPVSREN